MSNNTYRPMNESNGSLFNEMSNFIDVQSSYSDFVTNAAILNGEEAVFGPMESGPRYQFQSRREVGLNVFCQICIVRPRGSEFQVNVPWLVQEVCPHCQGQKVVYSWNADNSAYEAARCEACGGRGSHSYDSEISILVNDSLSDQPVIRKRKAGRFNPSLGQRGDMIINITWVDQLPPNDATIN